MTTGVSVRALASPGFALALVVLVLNDHVLKTAYPGWVTGKLSDVAGLVFAPVLLGVLLTAWRVPRPMPVALGLVGLGFTFAKTTATGAAVASAIWSLTGVPTLIRADVTDLLALPALYGAWLIHGQVSERARGDWRSSVARTIGVAMVPVTAVATAATSCDDSSIRLTDLTVAQGDFAGPPHQSEMRILFSWNKYLDSAGNAAVVSRYDESRRTYPNDDPSAGHRRCDDAGTCWRVGADDSLQVQVSDDEGQTWRTEYTLPETEVDRALAGVENGCGDEGPEAHLRDLAVLGSGDGAVIAVAADAAGLLVRSPEAGWHLLTMADLEDLPDPPQPTPHEGFISPVPARPSEDESTTAPCEDPVTVSVTPNPQNGPPTTYVRCS